MTAPGQMQMLGLPGMAVPGLMPPGMQIPGMQIRGYPGAWSLPRLGLYSTQASPLVLMVSLLLAFSSPQPSQDLLPALREPSQPSLLTVEHPPQGRAPPSKLLLQIRSHS